MNSDLETWKEVHSTLQKAVQLAQDAVAVQAAQRRFWLEELNANLGDESSNIYGSKSSSVWKKPYVLRKKDIVVVKKLVAAAASKPVKRKAVALEDPDGKPAKKPRKKRPIADKRTTTENKTTAKKVKKKEPLPRSSTSPDQDDDDDDDTMSEHSYESDPGEHSFHDNNSERSFTEERPSLTAAPANMYEYHRPSSVEQHPSYLHHHHHLQHPPLPREYQNTAPVQKRTSPPKALAWGAAPMPSNTADARNLQMMVRTYLFFLCVCVFCL
jgi:hypothetical protein